MKNLRDTRDKYKSEMGNNKGKTVWGLLLDSNTTLMEGTLAFRGLEQGNDKKSSCQ